MHKAFLFLGGILHLALAAKAPCINKFSCGDSRSYESGYLSYSVDYKSHTIDGDIVTCQYSAMISSPPEYKPFEAHKTCLYNIKTGQGFNVNRCYNMVPCGAAPDDPCTGKLRKASYAKNTYGEDILIKPSFKPTLDAIVACWKGPSLVIASTGRCRVPPNGSPTSQHMVGTAVDIQGAGCSKFSCMAAGYCAVHPKDPSCTSWFASKYNTKKYTAKNPPPTNSVASRYFKCLTGIKGLDVAPGGDWNHVELAGSVSQYDTQRKAFKEVLKAFCANKCPSVKKERPGSDACGCF